MALKCPSCGGQIDVAGVAAGERVTCSGCGRSFRLRGSKSEASTATDQTPVHEPSKDQKSCPFCGGTIKAAAIKCKHCGKLLETEPAKDVSEEPTEPPTFFDESIYQDAKPAPKPEKADAPGPEPVTGTCPSCSAALPVGAVLCTKCGYHLETGQTVKPPRKKKRKRKIEDAASGRGDPFSRTAVPEGDLAPRYLGLQLIAYFTLCVGILGIGAGVVILAKTFKQSAVATVQSRMMDTREKYTSSPNALEKLRQARAEQAERRAFEQALNPISQVGGVALIFWGILITCNGLLELAFRDTARSTYVAVGA